MCAGKNRIVQVAATGSRKLFDAGRREVFLEWFAATCNVKFSASKAGVAYQTVFKHRMKDAAFEAAWDLALRQGYARIEARLLEAVHTPHPAHPPEADESPSPLKGEGLEEEWFDAQLALAILREQKRNVHGHAPKRQRTTARAATNREIADALAKRLRGFALRHTPHPARAVRESPSPSRGEGQE